MSREYLSDHPYFKARRDAYRLPSGKTVDPYFVVELPATVVCFGLTADEKVLMVKQYRHPVYMEMLELPGGFIDENEPMEKAVKRELLEETGYEFNDFTYLGRTAANPGVLNNFTHMYLARGGKKVADQQLDANEEIEVSLLSLEDVKAKVYKSEIPQSMHALCILFALKELGKL